VEDLPSLFEEVAHRLFRPPEGEGHASSARSGSLQQARKVKPGSLKPRTVDDWLAGHLRPEETPVASASGQPLGRKRLDIPIMERASDGHARPDRPLGRPAPEPLERRHSRQDLLLEDPGAETLGRRRLDDAECLNSLAATERTHGRHLDDARYLDSLAAVELTSRQRRVRREATASRRARDSDRLASARHESSVESLRRRMGSFGHKRVFSLVAVGLIVVVTAAMVVVLPGQPATAAVPANDVLALALPTPTPSPTPTPEPSPTDTPARSAAPIANSVFLSYKVQAGDNLTRIANDFGISVTTLYWANATRVPNPHLIKIGFTLLIPPVDGLIMTTARGDTVQSIADKNGIDPQMILDVNNMVTAPSAGIPTGTMLVVPGVPNKPLPDPTLAQKPGDWLNKLEWPVPGHHLITLRYGCTGYVAEPRFGSCRHWHNGLDIGANWGTPVVAAAAGTVIYAGWRKAGTDGAGGGIVVWISHAGQLYTTYNHLSGVTVRAGQKVKAGDQIGRVGETGAADGAHLHFEVWADFPWTGHSMAGAKDPLLYTKYKG
jgi:murein DD-endopeptidase MepM/ murein hydrolase activator NlpD